jgi:hypothetical protein
MPVLRPDRPPDRHIIEPTVENGGDLAAVRRQWGQRGPHRLDRGARFAGFTLEVGRGATEEVVIEETALAVRGQPDRIQGAIAVDGALPRQPFDPLQVLQRFGIGLAQIRPVEDHPEIGLSAQALHPVRLQFGDEVIGIELGAFGRLAVEHPPNPRFSVAAGR